MKFARVFVLAGLLVGVALRLYGLAGLEVFGDSASSIFFASRDIPELIRTTAIDSHPPVYYLLLRGSLDLYGWNELGARLPSLFAGFLTIAVLGAAGRNIAGNRGVVVAVWLAAVHPVLIYYSRLPRMYSLLVLLSMLVILAAVRRKPVLTGVIAWLALMVHYLAVVPVGVAALIALRNARHSRHSLVKASIPFAVAGLLWVPWLIYALPTSFSHTARTISGVPPPETIFHFLGSLAVFGPAGTFVSYELSVLLAAVFWVVVIVAFAIKRGPVAWPVVTLGIVLLGAVVVYIAVPAFGRPRFFIALVPLLVLTLVTLPGRVGAMVQAVAAIVFVASLVPTYWLERNVFELEGRRLTSQLDGVVSHHDAVVLQPWWQAGYLALHSRGGADTFDLRDVSAPDSFKTLLNRRAVWLVMTAGVSRTDPNFPVEILLDNFYHRVDERTIGSIRIVRYVSETNVQAPIPGPNGFGAVPAVQSVAAGQGVPVLGSWQRTTDQLVAFLHLDTLDGRGLFGRDAEPQDGLIKSNEINGSLLDKRGLTVPLGTPPGTYRINAGLYRRDTNQPQGPQFAAGDITVVAPTVTDRSRATFGQSLDLLDIQLQQPDPMRADRITIPTVDGSQTLTFPIDASPGEPIGVRLGWRTRSELPALTGFVHILDENGKLVAQSDSPPAEGAYPTETWQPETVVYDQRNLLLPIDLPDGEYRVVTGWYDASGTRLPVTTSLRSETTLPVATIQVKRR